MPVRCLIVDDEPLARQRLRALLEDERDVQLVGCCSSGEEAAAAIDREKPDVVFLDIEMPGLDGVTLARELRAARPPAFVFVTAHEDFALDAFELRALDYLLKPFTPRRFKASLDRVREHLWRAREADLTARMRRLLDETIPTAPPAPQRRFLVKTGERIRIVNPADVIRMDAEGNYVRLHLTSGDSTLVRGTIDAVSAELAVAFVRVHRSAAVRLTAIRELRHSRRAGTCVVLKDGASVRVGRRFWAAVQARIQDLG